MKLYFSNCRLAAWLNKVAGALRKGERIQITRPALSMHDMPQITTGWDYKPTQANRRDRPYDYGGAGDPEVARTSTSNENDDVWHNFMSPDPSVENAPSSGDANRVSRRTTKVP